MLICIFTHITYATPVQENEAKQWVNDTGHKLLDTLSTQDIASKYEILDNMFNEDIDTKYMARFVIGKYWKLMDKEQQDNYLNLFNRYALSIYKNYPLDFDTKEINFKILSVTQNQKFTDVACSITLPKQYASKNIQDVTIKFKLTKENQKIKIVDLVLAQSSLLQTYRQRFYKMIEELDGEISWFLEDFNDMVTSSEKTAAEKADY